MHKGQDLYSRCWRSTAARVLYEWLGLAEACAGRELGY